MVSVNLPVTKQEEEKKVFWVEEPTHVFVLSAVQIVYSSYFALWKEVVEGGISEERCGLCWGPARFYPGGRAVAAGDILRDSWIKGALARGESADWRDAPLCEACAWAYSEWNGNGVLVARGIFASPAGAVFLGGGAAARPGVTVCSAEDDFWACAAAALKTGELPYVLAAVDVLRNGAKPRSGSGHAGIKDGILLVQPGCTREYVVFFCDGMHGWIPAGGSPIRKEGISRISGLAKAVAERLGIDISA